MASLWDAFMALVHARAQDYPTLVAPIELPDFRESTSVLWGDGSDKLVGLDRDLPNLDRTQSQTDNSGPLYLKERRDLPRPIETESSARPNWAWSLKKNDASSSDGASNTFSLQPVLSGPGAPPSGPPLAIDVAELDPTLGLKEPPPLILSRKASAKSRFKILATPISGSFLAYHCDSQQFLSRLPPGTTGAVSSLGLLPLPTTKLSAGSQFTAPAVQQLTFDLKAVLWVFKAGSNGLPPGKYSITHQSSGNLLRAMDNASTMPMPASGSITVPSSSASFTFRALASLTQPVPQPAGFAMDPDPAQSWTISPSSTSSPFLPTDLTITSASSSGKALAQTSDVPTRTWNTREYVNSSNQTLYLLFSKTDGAYLGLSRPNATSNPVLYLCSAQRDSKTPVFSSTSDVWLDPIQSIAATDRATFETSFAWLLWDLASSFSHLRNGTYRIEHVSGTFLTTNLMESDQAVPLISKKSSNVGSVPTDSLWDLILDASEPKYSIVHRLTGRTLGLDKTGALTANKTSSLATSTWSLAAGISVVTAPGIASTSDAILYSLSPLRTTGVSAFITADISRSAETASPHLEVTTDLTSSQQWRITVVDLGKIQQVPQALSLLPQPLPVLKPYAIVHIASGKMLVPPPASLSPTSSPVAPLLCTFRKDPAVLWNLTPTSASTSTFIVANTAKTFGISIPAGQVLTAPLTQATAMTFFQSSGDGYLIKNGVSAGYISIDGGGNAFLEPSENKASLWRLTALESLVTITPPSQTSDISNELKLPDGLYQIVHKHTGATLQPNFGIHSIGDVSLKMNGLPATWYIHRLSNDTDLYMIRAYDSIAAYLDASDGNLCCSWDGDQPFLFPRNAVEESQHWTLKKEASTGSWIISSPFKNAVLGCVDNRVNPQDKSLPLPLLQVRRQSTGLADVQKWDFKQVRPWFSTGYYHIVLSTAATKKFLDCQQFNGSIWQLLPVPFLDSQDKTWLVSNQPDGSLTLQPRGMAKWLTAAPITVQISRIWHVEEPHSDLSLSNTCNGKYSRWFLHQLSVPDGTFTLQNCATGFNLNLLDGTISSPATLELTAADGRDPFGTQQAAIRFERADTRGKSFDDLTSDKIADGSYTLSDSTQSRKLMFPANVILSNRVRADIGLIPNATPPTADPAGISTTFNVTATQDGYFMIWQSKSTNDQGYLVHETASSSSPSIITDVVGMTSVDGTDSVRWKLLQCNQPGGAVTYRIINKESGGLLTYSNKLTLSCVVDSITDDGQLWRLDGLGAIGGTTTPIRREVTLSNGLYLLRTINLSYLCIGPGANHPFVAPKTPFDPQDISARGCLFTISKLDNETNWYTITTTISGSTLTCLGGGQSGTIRPHGSAIPGDSGIINMVSNPGVLTNQYNAHWKFLQRRDGLGPLAKDGVVIINRLYPLAFSWRAGDIAPSCGSVRFDGQDNQFSIFQYTGNSPDTPFPSGVYFISRPALRSDMAKTSLAEPVTKSTTTTVKTPTPAPGPATPLPPGALPPILPPIVTPNPDFFIPLEIDAEDGKAKALAFVRSYNTDLGGPLTTPIITALWLRSLDGKDGRQLWNIVREPGVIPPRYRISTLSPNWDVRYLAVVQGRVVLVDKAMANTLAKPIPASTDVQGSVEWAITPIGNDNYQIGTTAATKAEQLLTFNGTKSACVRLASPATPNTGPMSIFSPFIAQPKLKGTAASSVTQTWGLSRAGVYISNLANPLAILSGAMLGPPPIITKFNPFACNPATIWHVVNWNTLSIDYAFNTDPKFMFINESTLRPLATGFIPTQAVANGSNRALPKPNDCLVPFNPDDPPFPGRLVNDGGALQIELLKENAFLCSPGLEAYNNSTSLVKRQDVSDPNIRGWQFLSVTSTDWPGLMGLPRQVLLGAPGDELSTLQENENTGLSQVGPFSVDESNQRWRQVNMGTVSLFVNEATGSVWMPHATGDDLALDKLKAVKNIADIQPERKTYRLQLVDSLTGMNGSVPSVLGTDTQGKLQAVRFDLNDKNQEWTFREWELGRYINNAVTDCSLASSLSVSLVSNKPCLFTMDFANVYPVINNAPNPSYNPNCRDCFFPITSVPRRGDPSPYPKGFMFPESQKQVVRFIRASGALRLADTRQQLELFIKSNAPIFVHATETGENVPVDVEAWLQTVQATRGTVTEEPGSLPTDEFDPKNSWLLKPVPNASTLPASRPKIYITVRPSPDQAYVNYTDITYHLFYPPVPFNSSPMADPFDRLTAMGNAQRNGFVPGWKSLTMRYNNETLSLESIIFGSNPDNTIVPTPRDSTGGTMQQPRTMPNIDANVTGMGDVINPLKLLTVKNQTSAQQPQSSSPSSSPQGKLKLHIFVTPFGHFSASFIAPLHIVMPSMTRGAPTPLPPPPPPLVISEVQENQRIVDNLPWSDRVDAGAWSQYAADWGVTSIPPTAPENLRDNNPSMRVKDAVFELLEAEMLGDDERGGKPRRTVQSGGQTAAGSAVSARQWTKYMGLWASVTDVHGAANTRGMRWQDSWDWSASGM